MSEIEDFAKEQEKEYGTYVATQVINHDGARAYNPGDAVPVSNVEKYGYLDAKVVAKVGTKAAEKAVDAPVPATPTVKG